RNHDAGGAADVPRAAERRGPCRKGRRAHGRGIRFMAIARRSRALSPAPDGSRRPAARQRTAARSDETDRLQIIIRLDDLDQAVLGRAVAAIGVGVVTLDQLLEARLDLHLAGAGLEAERVERLALGVAHRARFHARLLLGAKALAEQPERIADIVEVRPHFAFAGAHLPGRT